MTLETRGRRRLSQLRVDLRRLAAPSGLVVFFVISRFLVARLGYQFDATGIWEQVQDVDTPLLEHHLGQSLWWLSGQPPLWNLFLGLVVKAAPVSWPDVFRRIYELMGLIETLMLYALLVRVRAPRILAAVLAGAFMVTPPVLTLELSLTYEYPTLLLVTATVLLAARAAERPTTLRMAAVFTCASALVYSRTLFQVVWLLLLGCILLVAVEDRRAVIVGAAVPLLAVVALYVKADVMFGTPATSTWAGMGLARIAEHGYSLSERQKLVDRGVLHRVSLVEPLSPLSDYAAVQAKPKEAPTGIPLLDEPLDAQHHRNLHNKAYITISREYWHDDLWLIEHHPGRYLRSVVTATDIFFRTPDKYPRFGWFDRWFRRIVYGAYAPASAGLLLLLFYAIALTHATRVAVTRLRRHASPQVVALSTAALTTAYVAALGNTTELGENYRFRLYLDPLLLVILVHLAMRLKAARSHRRHS